MKDTIIVSVIVALGIYLVLTFVFAPINKASNEYARYIIEQTKGK